MAEEELEGPLLVRVFHGAFDKLTRPPVLTIFAWLQGVLVLLLAVVYLASLDGVLGPDGDIVTGDFVAFYTGGEFLREGRGAELYDLEAQRAFQIELTGVELPYWQPYVNPPGLGLVVSLWSALPYIPAFYVFSGLMVAAMVVGFALLRPSVSALARTPGLYATLVLLVFSFHPIVRTMVGGQNTALTLGLLTAMYACVQGGRPVLAGLFFGLVTYKPQYVPLLGFVLLFHKQWTTVLVGASIGLAHYAAGALVAGWDWPFRMLATMAEYRPLEWEANVHTHFSIVPFTDNVLPPALAQVTQTVAIPVVIALVLWVAWKTRLDDDAFPASWGVALTGSMLISPHLQYYDAGVLALPVLLGLDTMLRRGHRPTLAFRLLIAAAYIGYPVYQLAEDIGFQPLFLYLIATFAWLAWLSTVRR